MKTIIIYIIMSFIVLLHHTIQSYYWNIHNTGGMRMMYQINQTLQNMPRPLAPIVITPAPSYPQKNMVYTVNQGTTQMNIIQQPNADFRFTQESEPVALKQVTQTNDGNPSWFKRMVTTTSSSVKRLVPSFSDYVTSHKKDLATKILIAGYCYTNYILFSSYQYLQSPNRWSTWKGHLSLAQMLSISHEDLSNELLFEIRRRYTITIEDQENISIPLMSFIQDIDKELHILNRYRYITSVLLKIDSLNDRCLDTLCNYMPKIYGFSPSYLFTYFASKIKIHTIFYIDESMYAIINERISRILYLKQLIANWLANYKTSTLRQALRNSGRFCHLHLSLPSNSPCSIPIGIWA